MLIGLRLPAILQAQKRPAAELALLGLTISAVVILSRLLWVNTVPYIIRAVDRRPAQRARRVGWRLRTIVGSISAPGRATRASRRRRR